MGVTPAGTVLVADRHEPFVRVWSRGGDLLAWFGDEGQGPSEMQSARVIGMLDNESIFVVDTRQLRWTLFTPQGSPLDTMNLRTYGNSMAYSSTRRAVLSVGNAATPCTTPSVREASIEDGMDTLIAELSEIPTRDPGDCPQEVYSFAAHPDRGFAVGFGDPDYLVREYDAEGSLRHEIRRELPRVDKTEAELEADRAFRGRLGRSDDIDPLRFHFYGDSLRYDSEGRLWVRTARGAEGNRVFDIFGDGELLDEITVPLPVSLKATAFAVAGDYLVVSSPDELGNPRVTLFELAWR